MPLLYVRDNVHGNKSRAGGQERGPRARPRRRSNGGLPITSYISGGGGHPRLHKLGVCIARGTPTRHISGRSFSVIYDDILRDDPPGPAATPARPCAASTIFAWRFIRLRRHKNRLK
ncbi:hypothetical protein EVAR_75632_1 [Eumeta japonica]|uniref:Uncharacterized protein n=1 Tax=Eumeta variegata TaxID=151549 RepID=A0A4C1U0A1_EUMVA|nr:hypothetical protein EVAR_75632_1 [Eumeta japonica]